MYLLPALGIIVGAAVTYRLLKSGFLWRLWFFKSTPFPKRFGAYAVITGATDGIGQAIAHELARRNMKLVLLGRSEEGLKASSQRIRNAVGSDTSITTFQCDLSSAHWSAETSAKLASLLKPLDVGILVHSAGISYPSALKLEEVPEDLIDDMISVNLRAGILLARMVLPGMRERKRGAILCIGSGASVLPTEPLYAAYVASKAAIEGFCRSLQIECVNDNIVVQCHTPLLVTTKLSKIRSPGLTVPTPERFAKESMHCLEASAATYWMPTTRYPNLMHALILLIAESVPTALWSRFRFGMTADLRKRYLNKQEKGE